MKEIHVPISLGELIDKITILKIKAKHLSGPPLANATKELSLLQRCLDSLETSIDATLLEKLQRTNQELWDIEDQIRIKERDQDFGEKFVQLARSVYQINDQRAALKRQINIDGNSPLVEEKSYQSYDLT